MIFRRFSYSIISPTWRINGGYIKYNVIVFYISRQEDYIVASDLFIDNVFSTSSGTFNAD
jgi:hypothetical protein